MVDSQCSMPGRVENYYLKVFDFENGGKREKDLKNVRIKDIRK